MSSSGRARSMKACRLERKTRKRWSRRMSTDAGCTHFGSNGSIPMRPVSIAARMSRSESTTTPEYGGLGPAQREHGGAQLAPGAHALLGDAAIARLLADTHEGRELVIERVDVLDARVHDLEAEIRERVALGEPLEHHLADPSGWDLGHAALPDARLELVDEPIDLVGGH